MTSIQQKAENFIRAIMSVDLCEGLTEGLKKMNSISNEFICQVAENQLQELDETLFEHSNLRRGWVVEHKDVGRQLLTGNGLLEFSRRYYRHKKTGERKYLLDDLVGIAPGERIEVGLVADVCRKATDNSYAKSAQICCDGQITRQTVMNKTRKVENCRLEEVETRKQVKVVHVQADEDHVAMQDGRRDAIVKLVAIHENAVQIGKNRWQLPQRHLLSSYKEPVEDFWLRVADEISRRYGDREDLRIYIHGDGANWIRGGTGWLRNSHFVLDKFHVKRLLNRVTGNNKEYKQCIWDLFEWDRRDLINALVRQCIENKVCAENTGEEFIKYIRNNWDGIQIWFDERHNVGGSCAEGLVSHVLSSRLSSRPCAWFDEGLETISQLRVHVLNGGTIKPENIRRRKKPVVQVSKRIKKNLKLGGHYVSNVLHADRRSSPEYRLFKAITNGGLAI